MRNTKGFSLIELVIGLALVTGFIYLTTFFTQTGSNTLAAEENSICEALVNSSMNRLQSIGYEKFRAAINNDDILAQYMDEIGNRHLWPEGDSIKTSQRQGSSYYLNTHRTIVGVMSLLGGIYNSNINFCQSAQGLNYNDGIKELLLQNTDAKKISNIDSRIRIQMYNILDGSVSCPSVPKFIRPISNLVSGTNLQPLSESPSMGIVSRPPNVEEVFGYEVTLTTSYDSSNGSRQNCSAKTRFQYPRALDNVDLIGTSINISSPSLSRCQNGRANGALTVNRHSDYGQKGYTYLCRDTSFRGPGGARCPGGHSPENVSVDNSWVPCERVTLCGRSPSSVYQGNAIRNTYSNIPWACRGRVEMKILDPAGNMNIATISDTYPFPLPDCQRCSIACPAYDYCPPHPCNACPPPPENTDGSDDSRDGGDTGSSDDGCDDRSA